MKIPLDFKRIYGAVIQKPPDMVEFARERTGRAYGLLKDMPPYACPPSCNSCCHGSILISYVEFVNMVTRLDPGHLETVFAERLGTLKENGQLLCPFLNAEKTREHCTVYRHRPLICRVFGTTAAPCPEEIDHPPFAESQFFRAYNLLYYGDDGGFFGLELADGTVLYKAPFDIWAIADSGNTGALVEMFRRYGSMRSVLCDLAEDRFFTIEEGRRHYIS